MATVIFNGTHGAYILSDQADLSKWPTVTDGANVFVVGLLFTPTIVTGVTGIPADATTAMLAYDGHTVTWPGYAPALQAAQTAKIAALNAACGNAIDAGFPSSALGTANIYTLTATDQTNLISAYTAAQQGASNAKAWAANTAVTQYTTVLVGGVYYLALTGGTTGATTPTWPTAFQQTVADGTVMWALAGWLLGTATGNQWHTVQQVGAVYNAYLAFINGCRAQYTSLVAQVNAATSIAAVQAVIW